MSLGSGRCTCATLCDDGRVTITPPSRATARAAVRAPLVVARACWARDACHRRGAWPREGRRARMPAVADPAHHLLGALVLVWSPLDAVVASDARRPDVVSLVSRDAWLRIVVGLARGRVRRVAVRGHATSPTSPVVRTWVTVAVCDARDGVAARPVVAAAHSPGDTSSASAGCASLSAPRSPLTCTTPCCRPSP